jgi:hypothetical protein
MDTLRIVWTVWAVVPLALSLGCAGPSVRDGPAGASGQTPNGVATPEPLRLVGVSRAEAMWAAEDALSGMHFVIEKFDTEQGIIRTEPLRGAQFFEFWRSDDVGLHDAVEANLHSIRRAVDLQVTEGQGQVSIDCHVQVQRLSLPENATASVSQAYRMHSASTLRMQRLQLTPQQRQRMAWIDTGQDPALAAMILERIGKKLRAD